MTSETDRDRELLRLHGLLVDSRLDDADTQQLNDLLKADASARAIYRALMDVHARLLLHHEPVPIADEPADRPKIPCEAELQPSSGNDSTWWEFAAAAAIVLMTGLNAIQSAGNLTAARESAPPTVKHIADAEAEALADAIGLTPGDVKRMVIWSSQRD